MSFPTHHLPGAGNLELGERAFGDPGKEVRLSFAALTPALLEEQMARLRAARARHLAGAPPARALAAVDGVARRLLDDADPLRGEALRLLPPVTGCSPEMARRVLDGMAAEWREDALRRLLERELGDPRVLTEFRPLPGGTTRTRAFPPRLVTHVFSGNVPGVAVTSLIRALVVGSASLGKSAAGEPVLPALFCRALAREDAGLGECVAVAHWAGGDEALEAAAFGGADAVIAYGGAAALSSIRARLPAGVRFLGYGPHLSLGVVLREATGDAGAVRAAALAVATFDQQGCVSPHAFIVEEGGARSPGVWAEALAGEMESLGTSLPRARLSAAEAQAIQAVRAAAEFAVIAGRGRLLASAGDTSWTVVVAGGREISPSCLNRSVAVHGAADLDGVEALLAPLGRQLQTVGVAGEEERARELAGRAGALGATRVTALEAMPWPPAEWHHDGRPALTELLRWTDLEGG